MLLMASWRCRPLARAVCTISYLLDLMMPRMDGWAFRQAQLRDKKLKDIPVVVLSAVSEIGKPIKADEILRKPVDARNAAQDG